VLEVPKSDRITERRSRTRAEIIGAAWELVRANGLAGLSLRDLAQRVGMRAPSLYSYFDSKDAIYDAMYAEGYRAFREVRLPDLEAVDGRAAFAIAARRFFEFCTEDPARYQLMFQRTIPGWEPTPESYAVAVEVLSEAADAFARMGLDDPAALDLWTALMTGLTDQQISNDPGGDRWERLLDRAVDMYCDHLGVTG
jgi:AcrR family transcriptional regulator